MSTQLEVDDGATAAALSRTFLYFQEPRLELSFRRKMDEIWCYEEHQTSAFAKNNCYQFISTESIIMD